MVLHRHLEDHRVIDRATFFAIGDFTQGVSPDHRSQTKSKKTYTTLIKIIKRHDPTHERPRSASLDLVNPRDHSGNGKSVNSKKENRYANSFLSRQSILERGSERHALLTRTGKEL
jgi:hypothetical protein